jgi:hypothetical protein
MKCKYHLCEKEATETSQYCGTKCKNKWTQSFCSFTVILDSSGVCFGTRDRL